MKIIFTLIALTIWSANFGQEPLNIIFTENSEVKLNQHQINHNTTLSEIVKLLGEPELIKEMRNGKKQYIYAKHGLAIQTLNDKLIMIGANFNWDGDKQFPETSYKGQFQVGKITIDKTSTENIMSEINFLPFHNLFESLFVAAIPGKNVAVMVGFKDNLITQMGFEFSPVN